MPSTAAQRSSAPSPRLIVLAVGLGVLLTVVLFGMAVTEWQEFRLPYDMSHDNALTNQAFYLTLHGHGQFRQTVDPIFYYDASHTVWGILAGHFSPIFYLLLPLYALRQSLLTLFLIGACAVAIAGVAVMLLAGRIYGSIIIAAVWFGLFAMHPAIAWSIAANGFREMFVATGFLGLALLFYAERRDRLFLALLVPAVLCKEDIALLLPIWGLVVGLQRRGRRLAWSLILFGVGYFLAVNAFVLPLLRGEPPGHVSFPALLSPLGNTPGGLAHSLLSAPLGFIRLIVSRQNLAYWAAIFGPLLFLPLLGWEYLMIPAYVYAEISLDPFKQYIPLRYGVPAIPFIFVAAMVGLSRLVGLVERLAHQTPGRATVARTISLGVVLCGMVAATAYSTPFPTLLRNNWPGTPALQEDASLMRALIRIPVGASLAATRALIAESPNREHLTILGTANFSAFTREYAAQLSERGPDYLAMALPDMDAPELFRRIVTVVCQGTYGVVYADGARFGRLLLARGAGLSMNRDVAETLFPTLRPAECPRRDQQGISPRMLLTAARVHVRRWIPSEVRAEEMFPGPVAAGGGGRFTQVIYLPDQTFEPGRYRLELVGAWPWWGAPGADRVMMRVRAGGRTVGEVTAGGDQPLRYTTPPFRVNRRATLPIQVQAALRVPEGTGGRALWAYRPEPGGCASIADAPSPNPRQVTVEAWIYAEGLVPRPGAESEAPILSKNNALGYYLRLSGDDQGKVWADFNVAGRWALGRAGTVPLRQWVLVTATYDGQEARIYLNGHPVPQIPSRSPRYAGRMQSRGVPLVIGCRDPGRPEEVVFPGLIASARVWNRVLTPREIADGTLARPVSTRREGLALDFRMSAAGVMPDANLPSHAVTNPRQLTHVAVPANMQPLVGWRIRELDLLQRVTVRSVNP